MKKVTFPRPPSPIDTLLASARAVRVFYQFSPQTRSHDVTNLVVVYITPSGLRRLGDGYGWTVDMRCGLRDRLGVSMRGYFSWAGLASKGDSVAALPNIRRLIVLGVPGALGDTASTVSFFATTLSMAITIIVIIIIIIL